MNMRNPSDLAAAIISAFEGPERLTSYQDANGVWTIGYGHTHGVTAGMTITHELALSLFEDDMANLRARSRRGLRITAAA
jgi:GH24 family phage-related lysozyme (muramidase)